MKKPLKAPAAMPTPMPASVHSTIDSWVDAGSMLGGEHDVDQRDHRAGRKVEAAGQDDEGLADRGERQRGAARST